SVRAALKRVQSSVVHGIKRMADRDPRRCRSLFSPGKGRACGIVPDRANQDSGKTGKPPVVVADKEHRSYADIRERPDCANRIEAQEAAQDGPKPFEALVKIGQDIVHEEIE